MDTALTVAIFSGLIAFVSAAVTVWGSFVSNGRTLRFEAEKEKARVEREIGRYQEPLAAAVYDLQNRIYNVVEKVFVQDFIRCGSERQREYAVENTTFLVAQYLCCVELLRRGVQSSGHGAHLVNHRTMIKQDMVSSGFGARNTGSLLLLYAGEQRAVGESLIRQGASGLECMGYREFLQARRRGEDRILDYLRDSVEALAEADEASFSGLKELHFLLLDLLLELDPDFVRFPRDYRRTLSEEHRVPTCGAT